MDELQMLLEDAQQKIASFNSNATLPDCRQFAYLWEALATLTHHVIGLKGNNS